MFVRFFKSNNPSSLILIPLIAIIMWAFGFASPLELKVQHEMPLYELLLNMSINLSWLNTFLALALLVWEAFILNKIVIKHEIITKQSYLPALFYIVIMSNSQSMLTLHPPLVANFFLLLAFDRLLSSYRKDIAFSQIFDAGFLVSIASLFYLPSIVLSLLLFIGVIVLRSFVWRDWVVLLMGLITPYLFVLTYYFYYDNLDFLWNDKFQYTISHERPDADLHSTFYVMFILRWSIVLASFVKITSAVNSGTQKTKKGVTLMIWAFVLSILSVLIAPEFSTKYVATAAIPASVFCAHLFVNMKRDWLAELLFLLLLGSVFANLVAFYF